MTIPLQRLDIQEYQIDDLLDIPPVEISRDAEIVQCLATEAKAVTGTQPATKGAGPACNGWMFITNGIPAICGYGVQCGGVHGADEWVNLESLQQVTEVYARTILRFLQRGD